MNVLNKKVFLSVLLLVLCFSLTFLGGCGVNGVTYAGNPAPSPSGSQSLKIATALCDKLAGSQDLSGLNGPPTGLVNFTEGCFQGEFTHDQCMNAVLNYSYIDDEVGYEVGDTQNDFIYLDIVDEEEQQIIFANKVYADNCVDDILAQSCEVFGADPDRDTPDLSNILFERGLPQNLNGCPDVFAGNW